MSSFVITSLKSSPPSIKSQRKAITEQKKTAKSAMKSRFQKYWDLLVPGTGVSSTPQGEFCRAFGRLSYEGFNNGFCNAHDIAGKYFIRCADKNQMDKFCRENAVDASNKHTIPPRFAHDMIEEYYGQFLDTLHANFLKSGNVEAMKLVHCIAELIMEEAENRLSEVHDDEEEYCGSRRTKSPRASVYVPE